MKRDEALQVVLAAVKNPQDAWGQEPVERYTLELAHKLLCSDVNKMEGEYEPPEPDE